MTKKTTKNDNFKNLNKLTDTIIYAVFQVSSLKTGHARLWTTYKKIKNKQRKNGTNTEEESFSDFIEVH